MDDPLHYRTIVSVSELIRTRDVSPVELATLMLDRIAALDPKLRSYQTVMADQALEDARRAETELAAGRNRGPLHGIPVAVKDLCDTKGVVTAGGCAVMADRVPGTDATVVARLREAGAVILGKLALTEGAMAGYNPAFAVPENPWREGFWPGASSSGSGAATATGLAYATLGSDTGGSIRHPAAVCGTVGLKPTWGRVSRHGVLDLAPSLDHVGPLARCAADAGIVLEAIAGPDPLDPTAVPAPVPDMLAGLSRGIAGLRIGWDDTYGLADLAPDFAEAVAASLEVLRDLGAVIVEVRMPERLGHCLEGWQVLCSVEAAHAHREFWPARRDEYGAWFGEWLGRGSEYSAGDYAAAHQLRLECTGGIARTMAGVDLLLCPSTPPGGDPLSPERGLRTDPAGPAGMGFPLHGSHGLRRTADTRHAVRAGSIRPAAFGATGRPPAVGAFAGPRRGGVRVGD